MSLLIMNLSLIQARSQKPEARSQKPEARSNVDKEAQQHCLS
jgi:hypothetical protein